MSAEIVDKEWQKKKPPFYLLDYISLYCLGDILIILIYGDIRKHSKFKDLLY